MISFRQFCEQVWYIRRLTYHADPPHKTITKARKKLSTIKPKPEQEPKKWHAQNDNRRLRPIEEMAAPRDKDREKVYYHGTGEQHAQEIIKSGYLKGRDKQERHALAPMKDHVYITPHLHYAQIYGIGGDMAGHENAHEHAKGDHAYVFEVHGKDLKDIHPDEDTVGEKVSDELKTKWNSETRKSEPDPANKHPWLQHLAPYYMTPRQKMNIKNHFIDVQSRVGKKLNKVMDDWQKYRLIDDGAHIAHKGPLPVSRAWKVHKSKFHLLKRDGSNFFDHAEEIPLK